MRTLAVCLTVAALHIGLGPASAQGPNGRRILPLKVVGTQVLNSRNEPVWLRGVNTACMEWTSDGEGHILKTVEVAIKDWKVNHIRLPLSQDRWFGKASEQKDGGKAYRALVKQVVDLCNSLGVYIMLDLHWSNAGEWGQQIGQHAMPDVHSLAFWIEVARVYKNHPAVIFDLYNEPHDTTWDVWLNGGTVTENDRQRGYAKTFEAVGMQALLDAVRATGAKNLIVAGGLDWSYDMSGFLTGYALKDPRGNGVLYANHNYPIKGDTHEQWLEKMKRATAKVPVVVSEFGGGGFGRRRASGAGGDPWVRRVLDSLQGNRWHWTAWDMHVSAGPTLISDWNYTPTPSFGVFVKQALEGKLERHVPPSETAETPSASVPQVHAEVIAKAIAALGGEAVLRGAKAVSWKTETTMVFNAVESRGKGQTTIMGLDHMRQEFEGEFGGNPFKAVTVVSGDKGGRVFGDNRLGLRADEIANEKRTLWTVVAPVLVLPLKAPSFRLESVADATVDGKPCAGVRVTGPDKKPFTLYFDKQSGLPARLVARMTGFMGEDYDQETLFSDYREVEGIRKAMRIVVKRDGERFLEQKLTEFRVLKDVPPATFEPPA